jgi:hypothetical protein
MIIHRAEMRDTLARVLATFTDSSLAANVTERV